MSTIVLSDAEFGRIRDWVHRRTGISLAPEKKLLVSNRLARRVSHHRLRSYGEYFDYVAGTDGGEETQLAIDLLTTNETSFFREPRHFAFLRDSILPNRRRGAPFRVWSAACSSGEEPYSIAMLLADALGDVPWEVLASDISTRILATAQAGHYPIERAGGIPRPYLERYCLKGIGPQDGTFRIDAPLRRRVTFAQVNLIAPFPQAGEFDLVFLRNVLIYFQPQTRADVVRRLAATLHPGGHLFVGHSESLHGLDVPLRAIAPAIYAPL